MLFLLQHDKLFSRNSFRPEEFFESRINETNKSFKELRAEAEKFYANLTIGIDLSDNDLVSRIDFFNLCRGLALVRNTKDNYFIAISIS